MKKIKCCPICESSDHREIITKNASLSSALLYESAKNVGETVQVCITQCNSCGHIFNKAYNEINAVSIYENSVYRLKQSKSGSMAASTDELYTIFQEKYSKNTGFKNCLEIGAGSNDFSNLISDLFYSVYSIDPSFSSHSPHPAAKNQKIIEAFFNLETQKKYFSDKSFDVIIARHVIEHVLDPKEFIKTALCCLKKNGVLYVEIPNSSTSWTNNNFLDIFNDHVHYFSINTFVNLCIQLKLNVQKIVHFFDNQHIGFFLMRQTDVLQSVIENEQKFLNKLKSYEEKGYSYAIWGLGAQGVALVDLIADAQIMRPSYLFDSDSKKIGLFTGRKDFPSIEAPNNQAIDNLNVIVITASLHSREIKKYIENLGFAGEVISF